ncbi:MAG TPA: hypothetical protein VEH57_04895 [Thermoplasmata archaeon]|nr:hypothetical protein [Thermoplasmata archaeon]
MRLAGMPLRLAEYPARTTTNRRFQDFDLASLDRYFLPPALTGFVDEPPLGLRSFVEDDNRGAISPEPIATLDGTSFHLSVKGIGSVVNPYASLPLDRASVERLTEDPDVRHRLAAPSVPPNPEDPERFITGEVWLRGSPYGGQGLEHARIALGVSERAELTSLEGFRIAPVVKIAHLPPHLEERIRSVHWFRRFPGPIVQEIRLVPSNVRIYFHAKSTLGTGVRDVFDRFQLDSAAKAVSFEVAFLRSTVPLLTLFPRSLRRDPSTGRYYGLDFHDVWLDKDAVVAPDGTVYFVDLEGIEEEGVDREKVREKIEDQVFRSLYEFLFAYEQVDQERARRFGGASSRKEQFVSLLGRALSHDRYARLTVRDRQAALEIRNSLSDEGLNTTFPLVDS